MGFGSDPYSTTGTYVLGVMVTLLIILASCVVGILAATAAAWCAS